MGKNMARINNNTVVNIEWYSNNTVENDTLKELDDRDINIGDIYKNGKFYRNDKIILTPLEEAQNTIDELVAREEELNQSYNEGVNSI